MEKGDRLIGEDLLAIAFDGIFDGTQAEMTVKPKIIVVFSLCILGLGVQRELSHSQTVPTLTVEADQMDALVLSRGESSLINRLSVEFSSFLGADAAAAITSLRYGTPISLSRALPGASRNGVPTTSTTIDPPTGNMDFGDVFITLALARAQLTGLGFPQPTPQQLRAVLVGGAIHAAGGATVKMAGILTMLSHKMGWGLIAENLGLKLAPVVSGLKTINRALMTGAASPTTVGIPNTDGQPAEASSKAEW